MEKLRLLVAIIAVSLLLLQQQQAVSETETESKKVVTRLRFYLQDLTGGESPTVWVLAKCNLTDILPSGFGKMMVMDSLVTTGPELNSGKVGRLQGTVTLSDLEERALAMVLNLVFTEGEYAGSTISIQGRNPLFAEMREAAIVGGTGVFRMATGYALTNTYFRDPDHVHSVYEYNVVIFHMDPIPTPTMLLPM